MSKGDEGGPVSGALTAAPPLYPQHCKEHANVAEPGFCGLCADARKAHKAKPLTLVPSNAQRCLIHLEPDVTDCRGCAADRKAAS